MADLNVLSRLDRLDWNFPRAGNTSYSPHALHWFPGNFIPQIPATLIQVLSKSRDIILDPFAGSGTTGVEAIRLGRQALLSDRMSICTMICRGKLAMLRGGLRTDRCKSILTDLAFEHLCKTEALGRKGEGSDPELLTWFSFDTLLQLRFLWKLIETTLNQDEKAILTAVFSDVLFDCASPGAALTSTGKRRRHHWGWVADNVRPKALVPHNAIAKFRDRLASFVMANSGLLLDASSVSEFSAYGNTTVLQQDARRLSLRDEFIDLVVSSPPYIGVIDYTHANRLLYNWMGWHIQSEREHEIGARFKRFRKNAVHEYLADMCLVRNELCRVLRRGAYCAFVIGEFRRFPGTLDQLLAIFSQSMALVWGPTIRFPSRRRVSDRAGSESGGTNMDFPKGMIFGIFGASLTGKTTLAQRVALALQLPLRSCGNEIRKEMGENGRQDSDIPRFIHEKVDTETLEWAIANEPCIVEGRFLDRVFPSSGSQKISLILLTAGRPSRLERGHLRAVTGSRAFANGDLIAEDAKDQVYRSQKCSGLPRTPDYILDTSEVSINECTVKLQEFIRQRLPRSD